VFDKEVDDLHHQSLIGNSEGAKGTDSLEPRSSKGAPEIGWDSVRIGFEFRILRNYLPVFTVSQ
jgi:hypothetical protein